MHRDLARVEAQRRETRGAEAEHAVDVDSGALIAITLQDADRGDTTTIVETAIAAAEHRSHAIS